MKKRRTLLFTVLALVLVAGLLVPFCWREWRLVRQAERSSKVYLSLYGDSLTFQQRVDEARRYTAAHGLNTQYVILVDFNKPSGDPARFRLYDLEARKTVLSSTCMHGAGAGSTDSRPAFSNRPGSNNSCLGKFHTAGRHTSGRVGRYRTPSINLVGKSGRANNNARRRSILIHGWAENAGRRGSHLRINPRLSQGCFAIESSKVRCLSEIVTASDRPILLWAYHNPT